MSCGCAASTMPLYCGLLLFQWAGHGWQIDLHMTFFAILAAVAVLADWRPIMAGAAVTAARHLLLDAVAPAVVFPGPSDFVRVLLHAAILVVETGALVVLANQLEALLLAQAVARNAGRHRSGAGRRIGQGFCRGGQRSPLVGAAIGRTTQQNAAKDEESNAALRSLAAERGALMEVVEGFRRAARGTRLHMAA